MKPHRIIMTGLLALLAGLAAMATLVHRYDLPAPAVKMEEDPLLGTPRLVAARAGKSRAATVLFSGADGFDADFRRMAWRLSARGITVVGIDLRQALAGLARAEGPCIDPHWAVQSVSQAAQKGLNLPRYDLPILSGIGQGGELARRIANTATPAVLGGAVAVDPQPLPPLPFPLCNEEAAGHGVPVTVLTPEDRAPGDRLVAELVRQTKADRPEGDGEDGIADLPVVELPAPAAHGALAIVYSGDGGWRDIDKDIAGYLQEQGMPTVGVDMLRYFWTWRAPKDAAADLSRLIRYYRKTWQVEKVVLVGYSFGADVLPALYNELPAEDRAAIVQMSLLAVGENANFEVTVGEFLDSGNENAQPTRPQLDKIAPGLLQCFDGKEDAESVCPALTAQGVEVITTEGGHHFDGDYESLARRILDGVKRRTGG